MASFFSNLSKGFSAATSGVLSVLGKANTVVNAAPEALAALGTLIAALEKPVVDIVAVKNEPLNIVLDVETVKDLQAVWPEIKSFLAALGVKS